MAKKANRTKRVPALRRRKNFLFLLPLVPVLAAGAAGVAGLWVYSKVTSAAAAASTVIPMAIAGSAGYMAARYMKADRNFTIAATVGATGIGYLSAKGVAKLKEMKEEKDKEAWCKEHSWQALLPGSGCK